MMARFLLIPFLVVLFSGCSVTEGTDQAEFEVDRFHTLYNSGEFEEIHQRSHKDFQEFVTASQLILVLDKLTNALGAHETSKLINWSVKSSFMGKGTKITLVYSATYENSKEVKETFTFHKMDNKIQLYNFNVSAAELNQKWQNTRPANKQTEI